MKLRQRPEDFVVREECLLQAAVGPENAGEYTMYSLHKRGITTPEAVRRAAGLLGVEPRRIRYCGLKDRHAVATQIVTIRGGPERAAHAAGLELKPLGRTSRPAGPREIARNVFAVTVRDLSAGEAERASERALAYARTGIPNHFDEQRFGSARATGEFPGEAAVRGDFEKAVRLVIATWSRKDRPDVKRRRRIVADGWGDWSEIKRRLDRSSERSIVTYLADHPHDFAGAFDRLPESLRSMVLSAFQSLVWNEVLSRVVTERAGESRSWTHEGRYDAVVFFEPEEDLARALADLVIPFPHRSARAADPAVARSLEEALSRRGLTFDSFRLRRLKKSYFWRGERRALAEVAEASDAPLVQGPSPDELNQGRFALTLSFALPPGAYATMFVKAAFGGPARSPVR